MAKSTTAATAAATVATAAVAASDPPAAADIVNGWEPAAPHVMPRMGETVMVMAQPDSLLRNNETGGYIAAGSLTPQTVTVTLLRRLQDGDLVLMVPKQASAAS